MNNCSGRAKFRNFQILLDISISSTIVTGKLTPKIKQKETTMTMWENQVGKFSKSKKVNA